MKTKEELAEIARLTKIGTLAYIEARSAVSARHKLPTRQEITDPHRVSNLFGPCATGAVLDELVKEKKINFDGLYYSTKKIDDYPL